MYTPRILVGAALVFGLAACSHQHAHQALPTTSGRATVPATPLTNAQIIGVLLGANSSEITEASLVAAKTGNANVRAFADRMVADHTDARREIQELADRRNIQAQPSRVSQHIEQATQDQTAEIQRRSGSDLDQQYMRHEVAEHRELLNTIDRELVPSTNDPEIRAALAKTRTVVQAHLEHARNVEAGLR